MENTVFWDVAPCRLCEPKFRRNVGSQKIYKASHPKDCILCGIFVINQHILRILLQVFLMKSTTMWATRKLEFLKCEHFRPERTYTGNKPVLGVFWGDRGATADTPMRSLRSLPPSCCVRGVSSIRVAENFELFP
jgi:hypothetical protein